jgi:hypothetical protein
VAQLVHQFEECLDLGAGEIRKIDKQKMKAEAPEN